MNRYISGAVVAAIIIGYTLLLITDSDANRPAFRLRDPGTEKVVDYKKYGYFSGIGTFEYLYTITDEAGLAKASGEGIDPNMTARRDPACRKILSRLKNKDPWKYIGTADPQADFCVWATTRKKLDPGIKLFFTAKALQAAGLYDHALKAYYAVMILYPRAFCWNKTKTWTWLVAPKAWDAVVNLTRMHPEVGVRLRGAFIGTEAAIDGNPRKNRVAVTPGTFLPFTERDRAKARTDVSRLEVVARRGGKVACVKYANGQWGLEVDGKPYIVKGVTFTPTKVGRTYAWNWMDADENGNKVNDIAYETWVDANRNGRRDSGEAIVGDFRLLKEMGCNTIRVFTTLDIDKELLRDLHARYGIRVILCDLFGAYTVNSMASWDKGTDYTDTDQRRLMKASALAMAGEFKDEPWLLAYVLGNENNLPADYTGVNATRTQAAIQPKEYARFLNEVAAGIHAIDPDHPVGVGNFGLGLIDAYAMYAPELDFIGVNDYAGPDGFGALWIRAKHLMDRPVLITEYGCDAYRTGAGVDEEAQASYLQNAWEDIVFNAAGHPGEGNALGGIVFEWSDEWWKDPARPPDEQDTEATVEMAFPDGWSQEEFLGIVGQGDGRESPFIRQPRKAYYMYKKLWTGQ